MDTGKISRLGILLALSIILSYLESLLPIAVSVPGIKLGLANTVTMAALYIYSEKEAGIILVLRVIMTGFIFSGISSIIFGLIGGCLCIIVMSFLKKFSVFSVMGISMAGAVTHNIGQIIAAFIVYLIWKVPIELNTYYINLALFMAFAVEYPDMEVLLFFIIPIKIKFLGILDAIFLGAEIIGGYVALIAYQTKNYELFLRLYLNFGFNGVIATAALVAMLNFFAFMILFKKKPRQTKTQKNFRKYNKDMKRTSFNEKFYNANSEKTTWEETASYRPINPNGARHKCAICGRTEKDGDLTFRYCSKCNGNYEYCQEHLYTHIHVK